MLTNRHVVENLALKPAFGLRLAGLTCRNNVVSARSARSAGKIVAAADETLINWAAYTLGGAKSQSDATQPSNDELDYGQLRLTEPVGDDVLADGQRHGFILLPAGGWALLPDAPLLIVQHSDGGPSTRMRYRTNTEADGSQEEAVMATSPSQALQQIGFLRWGVSHD
ncbi:hypothetical protein ACC808_22070 [Rhizobium ruizarguesonis]